MQYAGIIKNDFAAAPGTCVTFFTQGCPHRCPGCHNQETWEFGGGKEFTQDTLQSILDSIVANGVHRDFCIMGGEPMCKENLFLTNFVVSTVREKFPKIKIYLWTGYTLQELLDSINSQKNIEILKKCDTLIDGKFDFSKRDITLWMRGSSNQNIYQIKDIKFDLK